jgi:hypothetical protein
MSINRNDAEIAKFDLEGNVKVAFKDLVTNIDEATSTETYLGYAPIGTLLSDPLWKIKKITVSGTVTLTTYADGNALYDNVWNDRLILIYS